MSAAKWHELAALRSQIRLDMTPDGLRIQIVDEQNRPMFDSGSGFDWATAEALAFGTLLMELNRPADAMEQFLQTLKRTPGRPKAIYGIARAAQARPAPRSDR